MSENLYIRLGTESEQPCHWLVWSEQENEIIASGELTQSDDLATISEHAKNRKVVVFVPASSVGFKEVSLPKKGQRKFIQAIPFMLEEELAADVEDCCFLMGEQEADNQQVLVVSRALMTSWLSWLEEARINPDLMIPDVLAMPLPKGGWSVTIIGEELITRQTAWQGFGIEKTSAVGLLNFALESQPEPIKLHNYSLLDLGELDCDVVVETPELPMLLMTRSIPSFNMLQGEFKQQKQGVGEYQVWKKAAVLAAVALLTNIGIKAVELYGLNNQQQALKAEINQTFKAAFPETRRIVNVRSQLKQKLASLGQAEGNISVLAMMSQLQPAFNQTNLRAETIKFDSRRSELRLQAKADNFNQFESFRRLAEQAGFDVQQGAINNQGNTIVGSINVRSKV